MQLCQYRHVLGVEKEGIHRYRFYNIAIADTLMTIVGALIISYIYRYNFFIVFIVLLIIGTLLHKLFCVETTLTNSVFKK